MSRNQGCEELRFRSLEFSGFRGLQKLGFQGFKLSRFWVLRDHSFAVSWSRGYQELRFLCV
jgi:hypothetical protein